MRKFFVLLAFFTLTPLTITLAVLFLSYHSHKSTVLGIATGPSHSPFMYAALPMGDTVFAASATMSDKRPMSLTAFLSEYQSPLTPYAGLMVTKADQYGIDYRLLAAVAMQETTLCKKTLQQAPYNCWGFGIWGKHVTGFGSYAEAIDTISRYFGTKKEKGIDTLDAIGKIYNPGNVNNWKENVALVMNQL